MVSAHLQNYYYYLAMDLGVARPWPNRLKSVKYWFDFEMSDFFQLFSIFGQVKDRIRIRNNYDKM